MGKGWLGFAAEGRCDGLVVGAGGFPSSSESPGGAGVGLPWLTDSFGVSGGGSLSSAG